MADPKQDKMKAIGRAALAHLPAGVTFGGVEYNGFQSAWEFTFESPDGSTFTIRQGWDFAKGIGESEAGVRLAGELLAMHPFLQLMQAVEDTPPKDEPPVPLEDMTKAELMALATEHGIVVKDTLKKSEIIALLEAVGTPPEDEPPINTPQTPAE